MIQILVGELLAYYFHFKQSDLLKLRSMSVVALFLAVGSVLTAGLVISMYDSGLLTTQQRFVLKQDFSAFTCT